MRKQPKFLRLNRNVSNSFGVPLVSPKLHEKLFQKKQTSNRIDESKVEEALKDLRKFNIKPEKTCISSHEGIDLDLPPLKGGSVDSHFMKIGKEQTEPFLEVIDSLFNSQSFPPLPEKWKFQVGTLGPNCLKIPVS